jgi:hypothetical protein
MLLMSLFSHFHRKSKPPVRIEVVSRDVLRITIAEFKASQGTVAAARRILRDPAFLNLMDVLNTNLVNLITVLNAYPDRDERLFMADKLCGYGMALNDLLSLGELVEPPKQVDGDFTPDPE